MTRRKDPAETRTSVKQMEEQGRHLPQFEPVPVKYRHDGWTPERQKAFIAALADTGSISRACRHVNMSKEGAYYLRRRAGSEGFRRAWEAAQDFGVQRLKDIAFERAIDGQLSPVFVGGKLKGFRRIRNDRLLMFCLRMNMRGQDGKRLSASYFEPNAARLSGSPIGGSVTMPQLSRAEKDDMNAAIIENFDPVRLSMPEIEAMQKMLSEAAARNRAEEEGAPGDHPEPDFVMLGKDSAGKDQDWKTAGDLENLFSEEDDLEPFDPDEDDWRTLDVNVEDGG